MARYRLDTLGLLCPLPVRLTARKVQGLQPGDLLEVVGDDPAMEIDLEAWCHDTGHQVVNKGGQPPSKGPLFFHILIVEPGDRESFS